MINAATLNLADTIVARAPKSAAKRSTSKETADVVSSTQRNNLHTREKSKMK
ncbi:hypothetical protein GRI89_02320 [Altererythrobacter salegens]|uniref:Uncharacterized protein n=1 Tax=Croceibacterium salegens TaxID=1737568 RepID=A0A6I4SQZ5_9SPHN|nr:hypothetical protein [Croceibacterium salegens]MXO58381.1 hypothetical protein [Croceibacterium salegens]